ncbi:hypothetical protein JCM3775_001079 [Rhodotorula graminis]|uniref:Uncharacterized protein n=1 Tax=Rhodotorula graminis (strain WP1) TaxID=578459 RepID=A0A194S2S7_RHOGW|nr:uncharacterized protein RHOBADRAFT_53748 [Rhodotorula graminis WP1]KPV74810.1 hypothetical protein RHOBADRAFT_53748 [Rhodotorula graminis WP1]
MADSIQSLVEGILSNLPEGANPWSILRATLTAQVRPDLGRAFRTQLYVCSALVAAITLVLIACMVAKWRQGTYWLFRIHRATGGRFLVVHYASSWTTVIILFFGLLQGYIWQTVKYTSGDPVLNSDLWRMCVWWPGWLAFWLAAWSLRVSHVLHLDSSGRPSRAMYSQAWFINSGGVLVPALSATTIAILSWQAHERYVEAMKRFSLIDSTLAAAEMDYSRQIDTSDVMSSGALQLAADFASSLSSFGDFFRGVFWAYFGFTVLLEGILILTTIFHLRELRRTMGDLRGRAQQSVEARAQGDMIEQGYRSLRNITAAVVACCTAVNILFAYVAIAGRKVINDKKYSEVASLLPLWLFSLLGLPLSLLFLRRILSSAPARASREPSPSTQEQGSAHAVHTGAHSTPSTAAGDHKASTPVEEYAMASLGSLSPQHAVAKTDEYASLRQASPSLSAGSDAQLVSTAGELPFFASYETRAPPAQDVEEVHPAEKGSGRWGSRKAAAGRK